MQSVTAVKEAGYLIYLFKKLYTGKSLQISSAVSVSEFLPSLSRFDFIFSLKKVSGYYIFDKTQ